MAKSFSWLIGKHKEAKIFIGKAHSYVCLQVSGFQRQVFKPVLKIEWVWIPKNLWVPRTNTCKVTSVGTFVLFRIPRQAKRASCSGFRNCKWIPQMVNGFLDFFKYCTCILTIKARVGNIINSNVEFKSKDLTIVSGRNPQTNFITLINLTGGCQPLVLLTR